MRVSAGGGGKSVIYEGVGLIEEPAPPDAVEVEVVAPGARGGMLQGIRKYVEEHNRAVREELLSGLKAMPPDKFEELVGNLLVEMGLDEVDVTSYSGDGGIDVIGVLPFGGVADINVAVQVKRYSKNVQSPEIQKLRGSLDEHDYGFFITTSDFSAGAKEEAERKGGGKPIVLVNGRQVVNLLMEHGIGVTRSMLDVYELDGDAPTSP